MKKKNSCYLMMFLILGLVQASFVFCDSLISGRVVDEDTKKPIKGVEVEALFANYHSITNENGDFQIRVRAPNIYRLVFYPPEPYAYPRMFPWDDNKWDRIVVPNLKNAFIFKKLKIGAYLEIIAIDSASSKKIPNVYVDVIGMTFKQKDQIKDFTDENGYLKISQLEPGSYTIHFRKDGFWLKELTDVNLQSKITTTLEIKYDSQSLTKIIGTIRTKSGNPLKGVLIGISELSNNEGIEGIRTYSDENGNFSIIEVPPGEYDICLIEKKQLDNKLQSFPICKKTTVFKDHVSQVNFIIEDSQNLEKGNGK